MRNPSDPSVLPPGVRLLLEQVITALDIPTGDPGITGRAAAVTGALRTAVADNATDADCLILAGIIRDQLSITAPAPGDSS